MTVLWGYGGGEFDDTRLEAAREATPGWAWSRAGRAPDGTPRDVWTDLRRADVVVTHGGQNAVAEVAAARRPAVVVAQPRPFAEQDATVRSLDGAGIAVGLTGLPTPDDWPGILDAAVRRGGAGWARWSDGHGAERAAACVDRLAGIADSPDHTDHADPGGPTP